MGDMIAEELVPRGFGYQKNHFPVLLSMVRPDYHQHEAVGLCHSLEVPPEGAETDSCWVIDYCIEEGLAGTGRVEGRAAAHRLAGHRVVVHRVADHMVVVHRAETADIQRLVCSSLAASCRLTEVHLLLP